MFDSNSIEAPHLQDLTVFSVVVPDQWAFEFDAAAIRLMDEVLANNPDLEPDDTNLGQAKSALLQLMTAEYLGEVEPEDSVCDDCAELPFEFPEEEPPF